VFAVIAFCATKGGIAVDRTVPAQGEKSALRLAERLAQGLAGAAALSRYGDPEVGEFDPPVILASFGKVPADLADVFII